MHVGAGSTCRRNRECETQDSQAFHAAYIAFESEIARWCLRLFMCAHLHGASCLQAGLGLFRCWAAVPVCLHKGLQPARFFASQHSLTLVSSCFKVLYCPLSRLVGAVQCSQFFRNTTAPVCTCARSGRRRAWLPDHAGCATAAATCIQECGLPNVLDAWRLHRHVDAMDSGDCCVQSLQQHCCALNIVNHSMSVVCQCVCTCIADQRVFRK